MEDHAVWLNDYMHYWQQTVIIKIYVVYVLDILVGVFEPIFPWQSLLVTEPFGYQGGSCWSNLFVETSILTISFCFFTDFVHI